MKKGLSRSSGWARTPNTANRTSKEFTSARPTTGEQHEKQRSLNQN